MSELSVCAERSFAVAVAVADERDDPKDLAGDLEGQRLPLAVAGGRHEPAIAADDELAARVVRDRVEASACPRGRLLPGHPVVVRDRDEAVFAGDPESTGSIDDAATQTRRCGRRARVNVAPVCRREDRRLAVGPADGEEQLTRARGRLASQTGEESTVVVALLGDGHLDHRAMLRARRERARGRPRVRFTRGCSRGRVGAAQ